MSIHPTGVPGDRCPDDRSVIDAVQTRFVAQLGAYPENESPVHARWTNILTHITALRSGRLTDDLTPVYAHAEKHWTGAALEAALDLASLQTRFYHVLFANQLCMKHIMTYHTNVGEIWQFRLMDRWFATKPHRRTAGRAGIRPPKMPPLDRGGLH